MRLYRYLTGPDDATFCHRVSAALARGWSLHGQPTLCYDSDAKRVICGQAIVKEVEGEYSPELDLAGL
ncbi:DUF1737 domain-containing protein [Frateuria defendens]|uniref:DUF1737 domain-containing protein n=1 Tax=Frateuria defendens TaxID=2219559 RepID=UPI00066FDAA1|nr:DUF1737 domain-containing protein [Frateuria defendens]